MKARQSESERPSGKPGVGTFPARQEQKQKLVATTVDAARTHFAA